MDSRVNEFILSYDEAIKQFAYQSIQNRNFLVENMDNIGEVDMKDFARECFLEDMKNFHDFYHPIESAVRMVKKLTK